MKTRFTSTGKPKTRVKVIKETTEFSEHRCTKDCLSSPPRPMPKNLRRISLGYIYDSDEGYFIKWGKNDWLQVVGLTFAGASGGRLVKMFEPAFQMHIHSPGGRTIARATKEKEIRANESFFAQEAAKKKKRKGYNLRQTQNYLGAEAAKVISHAPKKRRKPKGVGRGAPGRPRSEFSKKVVSLFNEGRTEPAAVGLMTQWCKEQMPAPQESSVKKLVHRWYSRLRKSSGHKKARTSTPTLSVLQ